MKTVFLVKSTTTLKKQDDTINQRNRLPTVHKQYGLKKHDENAKLKKFCAPKGEESFTSRTPITEKDTGESVRSEEKRNRAGENGPPVSDRTFLLYRTG